MLMVRISTSLILAILLVGAVIVVAYQASDLFSPPVLRSSDGDIMDKISPYLLEQFDEEKIVRVDVFMQGAFSNDPKKILTNEAFDDIIAEVGEEKVYERFYPDGFIVFLTKKEVIKLANNKHVEFLQISFDYIPFLPDAVGIIDVIPVWETQILDEDYVFLTGEGQTICIPDTGIDFTHPDLEGKSVTECLVDCYKGGNPFGECSFDCSETDSNGHGTHVAGIAAASQGQGIPGGIGKGANLIGVKITLGSDGTSSLFPISRAFNWCVNNAEIYNISVISLSFGSEIPWEDGNCDGFAPYLPIIINEAIAKNISISIATGNHGNNTGIGIPACMSGVIPVAATNKDDTLWVNSDYNELVKLFAPGAGYFLGDEGILSTCASGTNCDNGIYTHKTGTSMSAPMVAGLISIYKQYMTIVKVTITPQEIEQVLFISGDPIVDLPPKSWTRINANQGFTELQSALQNQCVLNGGMWGTWGNHPDTPFTCNLATSDAGMACLDSSECESYCQAPPKSEPGYKVVGSCYEWEFAFCMQEVFDGIASHMWCI